MKLARLELSGFKSFADYTEFVFDDGITGIVGPNGCGKSNVVDAFKWVLGEMSARSLRGDGMLDVIFSGSGGRKPMGMAEVSLTFTNEDRRLPLDTPAVKITRRLYRDLTSEYLVNNQIARLKDIREIFLDTGIGVDAYSLIEQGRVTGLLESNSVDRRELFEEAAGISRFKLRKKEAARKLEKTDQNLAQSQLVLDEVEKQLRSVKLQAGKARNYQEYAAALRALRLSFALREYDELRRRLDELTENRETVRDTLAAVQREHAEKRAAVQDGQLELESLRASAHAAERELLAAQTAAQSAQQQVAFGREQRRTIAAQRQTISLRRDESTARYATLIAARDSAQAAVDELSATLETQERNATQAIARQEEAAKEIAELNRSLDALKSAGLDLLRKMAALNNELNGNRIGQEDRGRQKQRLALRQTQIHEQIKELQDRAAAISADKDVLDTRSAELERQAAEIRAEQEHVGKRQAELSDALARRREAKSAATGRKGVLEDLQARREGISQAARDVLKARDAGNGFAYVQALVADIVNTDVEYAPAIEAALGEMQQSLAIADQAAAAADAENLKKLAGRVRLVCMDRVAGAENGDGSTNAPDAPTETAGVPAVSAVRVPPEHQALADYLLRATYIVENFAAAVEASQNHPAARFVSRQGEIVQGAVWQLGEAGKRGGAISRRSELARLGQELIVLEQAIADYSTQISQCDEQGKALNQRQQQAREARYQSDRGRAEADAQLQQTLQQLHRVRAEEPLLAGEMESLETQIAELVAGQERLAAQASELETRSREIEKQVHEQGAMIIVRQHAMSELAEAATQARVAMGQVREQRLARTRELAAVRQNLSQHEAQSARLEAEAATLDGQDHDLENIIAEAQASQARHAQSAQAAEQQFAAETQRVETTREALAGAAKAADALDAQSRQQQSREQELSLACNDATVRMEALIGRAREELDMDLAEAHKAYVPAEMDVAAVSAEIADLKGRIDRLGNVNLEAIDQQKQLEDRHAFLTGQVADIVDAQRQLQEIIARINADSLTRFVETFNAVRVEFQEMFRKLFGGGKADIVLENPDDALESGIEIMARPPGKELQSISLLSGGEKTMAAVALVLSIFKSKPSPFCILDEVDAALDEANTGRFAAIVQEFLTHSQFIIITHNKRTMTIANTLYGVTMQEQGVSKRVAVQFGGRAEATDRAVPRAVAGRAERLAEAAA